MSIKDKAPEKSCDILLVGQVPPPFHGQSISIQRMLEGRYRRIRFFHIPMRFSREIGEVGRFGPRKLWHLLTVLSAIVHMRWVPHPAILFYQAAGGGRIPLYRDLAILCLTRRWFHKTAFFFHANGLADSYRYLPPGLRALYRRSFFGADLVLVPSEDAGKDLGALFPERCIVVPHGIQDLYPRYRPPRKETRGKVVLMFVGVVRESKGILVLLEACRTLKGRGRDFELRIVGDFESASFRRRFFSRAQETGLAADTDWRGPLTGDPKWGSYASADILCAPSFSESFGLAVLEAMQFAMPVVATPAGATPTMIEESRSGFLVPFNDSLALADRLTTLIDDPVLRERMGKRGREIYLERFTVERFWRNLEEALLAIA